MFITEAQPTVPEKFGNGSLLLGAPALPAETWRENPCPEARAGVGEGEDVAVSEEWVS